MLKKIGLGWNFGDWKAQYSVGLPRLSEEEKALVLMVVEKFRAEAERREVKNEQDAMQTAKELLSEVCEQEGIELDDDQEKYLAEFVFLHTWGFGFLQNLLSDPNLEEIAIIGIGQPVYVYKRKVGWLKTNIMIDSQEYFVSLVNRLGRNLGRRLTAQNPRLNAMLEDGSRIHASMPPVSSCELTIRKFTREPLSPFELAEDTYSAEAMALLSLCMQADMTIMIAGNTASGKTSTLNALLCFVPSSERLLLIEETPEISIPHPHQLRLLPFEEGGVGMVELVRDSLRMRPDRVVVGEIRTPNEAAAFLESALSGQAKGCYTTFHAQSCKDAMLRLRMMGCMLQDLEAIDVIVVQRRVSVYDISKRKVGERRCLTEIAVANPKDLLAPVAVFEDRKFVRKDRLLQIVSERMGLTQAETKKELERRERYFACGRPKGFGRAFEAVQKMMFGGK